MKKYIALIWLGLMPVVLGFANPVQIIDCPISWTEARINLIREYSLLHYGTDQVEIIPRAVVIHWTASDSFDSVYSHFYNEARSDGTLNVASQFVVDREGSIYRMTPETALNRHIIGYNWCSIGIENIGGVDGIEDLTQEQLKANLDLIRYLYTKYPTIEYVFGHYQQDLARKTGLYIENVTGYYSIKNDPGPIFMMKLKMGLQGLPLFVLGE